MPYNLSLTVFTQRNFVADFLQANVRVRVRVRDLGATYKYRLTLIGKRVADFLLVLIGTFFARSYG